MLHLDFKVFYLWYHIPAGKQQEFYKNPRKKRRKAHEEEICKKNYERTKARDRIRALVAIEFYWGDEGKIKGRMLVRVKHNEESSRSPTMNREEKARERFVATGEGITVVLPDEPVDGECDRPLPERIVKQPKRIKRGL